MTFAVTALLGFLSGAILVLLRDHLDRRGKLREFSGSMQFFGDSLCLAIRSRTSGARTVMSFDEVARRAFASGFGTRCGWRDLLIVQEIYLIWLAGGYREHADIEAECGRVRDAVNRIVTEVGLK
jgi:hypothetical protein